MWETGVQSLGQEDPLEKEMATHSSTLAWKIPWTEERSRLYSPWGRKESDTTQQPNFRFHPKIKNLLSKIRTVTLLSYKRQSPLKCQNLE